jgi:transcriptional regulator with XRE-family HTH domain
MHEFLLELAKSIKSARLKNNFTQVQLAEKLGITSVHVSTLENGHSTPSIAMLQKYREVTGIDPYCAASLSIELSKKKSV